MYTRDINDLAAVKSNLIYNKLLFPALYTSLCLLAVIVLVFKPDPFFLFLDKFTYRNYQELLDDRYQFYLDIALIWLVGLVFLFLDARCRDKTAKGLLRWLGAAKRVPETWPDRVVRIGTWVTSFIAAPALSVAYIAHLQAEWFFDEDGVMEDAQVFGFVCAAVLIGWCAYNANRRKDSPRWYVGFLTVLGVALIVVAMEELSWGQRILNIQTPDALSQINMQNELNFHNIFNTYIASLYLLLASVIFAIVSFSCWCEIVGYRGKYHSVRDLVKPDGSLILLSAIILIFSNHIRMNELVEFLASVVILLYAINIYARDSALRSNILSLDHPS